MSTTAVGWQGPEPMETEPTGWLGVSRETMHPARATDPDVPSPDSSHPQSAASAAAGAVVRAEPAVREGVEADPPTTLPPAGGAAEGFAGTGVPTAADLAALTPTTSEGTNPPLAHAAQEVVNGQRREHRPLPHPAATRVFVVANQKGGVGKTTTAVNVAAVLAQHGLRVLLVDLDPQGNASTALGVEHTEGTPSAYQVLIESLPVADVVVPCPDVEGLDVVPATIDLAGAEIELVSLVARETRLRRALDAYLRSEESADRRYDYVFIDCPPSLGLLTVNALSAGREMLIPIQCEYYALEGVSQLLRTLEQVREHLNPDLDLGRIVLTMFDGRTRLAAGVADEVREHFGDRVLKVSIPRAVRISEAPSYGQTVLTYDPHSPGAISYLDAAIELAESEPAA
jgi:chromosome partitioning protein